MNTNKILLGFAKSDPRYGLSYSKNFINAATKVYNLGIRGIDTSPTYENNYEIYSKIDKKEKLKFYTKLPKIDLIKSNIVQEVKKIIFEILKLNKIKIIHCLIIHDPLLPLSGKKWIQIYNYLIKLKKRGIIKKIGISVYNKLELDNILVNFTPDLVQFPLNVFNQEFYNPKYLKKLKQKKITLVARSVFLQGLLCNKKLSSKIFFKPWTEDINNWFKYVKLTKKKPEELCLAFVLSCKYLDYIILGVDNIDQLKKNLNFIKKKNQNIIFRQLFKFSKSDSILIDPRFWFKNKNYKEIISWIEANKYIMSGGMLLSKKPNQFLPGLWPSFYKKAKGCFIWDNDNNKYLDFSLMGVGTNIIGYSNNYVNSKLNKVINSSNVSTLNSNYDLILSRKLLKLHKWASKCFYARTGGEANAIALRIARCHTNKDEVAICGYHGWHDWYLSSNIRNKNNLDNLLLPGLDSGGIPKKLAGITHTFKYNDFSSLKKLINSKKNIGTIFMEVQRNEKPKSDFLKKVRLLCKKKDIVLIFDECTSGFRETLGGLHKKYNVNPDIAVFGKSLSNGVPLTAIIGKEKIMNSALTSFISSTFWSDALGPSAAIATLEYMEKTKSWKNITNTGKQIKKFWKYLSSKYNLKIIISGLDAMPMFNFTSLKNDYYKNFITQEMLKKNILASNVVYCSIDHHKYLNIYFKELEKIFNLIKNFERGVNVLDYLDSPNPAKGFKRLN